MARPNPLFAGTLAALLAACQPFGPDAQSVSGTLTFAEPIVLPPDAVAVISVEDVSRADAPADLLGRSEIVTPGNPPIPFEVRYDPAAVDPTHTYAVRAQILVDDQLWFTTDQGYPVITRGARNRVDPVLARAAPPPVDP